MKIKYYVSTFLVLALSTCFNLIAFAAVNPFSDLPDTHPNYTAIIDLNIRQIIAGYPDGTFKPDDEVNRVEALKMILLGSYIDVPDSQGTAGFTDTIADAWYAPYLNHSVLSGFVSGYPDGTFKPNQAVNLAENLKMLILANDIDLSGMKVEKNIFADTTPDAWYAPYLQYAKNTKLIEPDENNKVYPAQAMTRGKLAETMYRLIQVNSHGLDYYGQGTTEDSETVNEPEFSWDIKIEKIAYKPNSMTVQQGSFITWTNAENVMHTVTSDDGLFNSGDLAKDATFTYEFTELGTYTYHCSYHPGMTGTIIVKPANEVPTI